MGSSNWSAVWGIWTVSFALRVANAYIRNAAVMIDFGDGVGLQDVGLVANVNADFEPINFASPSGDVTAGYKVRLSAKMLQTALADSSAVMALPQKQLTQVRFVAEADAVQVSNFMFNPDVAFDMSGGESGYVLTGYKTVSVQDAINSLANA